MTDTRQRCPICECVMHGGRHYGAERICLLVLELRERIKQLESPLLAHANAFDSAAVAFETSPDGGSPELADEEQEAFEELLRLGREIRGRA